MAKKRTAVRRPSRKRNQPVKSKAGTRVQAKCPFCDAKYVAYDNPLGCDCEGAEGLRQLRAREKRIWFVIGLAIGLATTAVAIGWYLFAG